MYTILLHWSCALLISASTVLATDNDHPRHHRRAAKHAVDPSLNTSSTTTTHKFHNTSLSTTSYLSDTRTSSTTSLNTLTTLPSPSIDNATSISLITLTDIPPSTLNASQVPLFGCIPTTETYADTVPPTVYSTTTVGYDVTLSAANASLTVPPLLITPAAACFSIVISQHSPPASSSVVCVGICPQKGSIHGPGATVAIPPEQTETGSAYTSTVYITKKTPVPVIQQTSSNPPVFQLPSTTKKATPKPPANPTTPLTPNANNGNTGSYHAILETIRATTTAPKSFQPVSQVKPTTIKAGNGSVTQVAQDSPAKEAGALTSTQKPISTPNNASKTTPTASVPAAPASQKPSTVVIGGSVISIPSDTAGTTLQVDGKTYTVKNSEIIGPGTTIPIAQSAKDQVISTPTPKLVPETVAGVTFSVDSTKVVIAGTTYKIGPGAKPTTVVVGGNTISIGENGVGFASTTVSPVKTTVAEVSGEVTLGGLTFSVDRTQAALSGTTYKLGPGAATHTTVIGGHTISIGPSGVAAVSGSATGTGSPSSPMGGAVTNGAVDLVGMVAVALLAVCFI